MSFRRFFIIPLFFIMFSLCTIQSSLFADRNVSVDTKNPPTPSRSQIGVGFTLHPARALWTLDDGIGYYLFGGSIDILGRVHPRVGLELSLGTFGSLRGPRLYMQIDPFNMAYVYTDYVEASFSLAVRSYLRELPVKTQDRFIMPYIVCGPAIQIGFSSLRNFDTAQFHQSGLMIGGLLGAGLEFRFHSRFVVHLDARMHARGYVNAPFPNRTSDIGLQIGTGFAFFP